MPSIIIASRMIDTIASPMYNRKFPMLTSLPKANKPTLAENIDKIIQHLAVTHQLYRIGVSDETYVESGLQCALTKRTERVRLDLTKAIAKRKDRAEKQAMSPHPALHVNGLSSVAEDPSTTSPVQAAAIREDRKLAMLRRMRPPPLKCAWNVFHDKYSEKLSYDERLTIIKEDIVTLKPFWSVLNNLPINSLKMKDSIHFFKRGVKPVWEDSRNINGGSWTFRVKKSESEQFWQEILMMAVGEQFASALQPRDDICGVTFSTRFNSNLISIWNRDGSNQTSIENILNVVLDKMSPELKPSANGDKKEYYYKKHSEHAGYEEVAAAAKEAARKKIEAHEAKHAAKKEEAIQKEDKIEDALVTEEEGNKALLKDHEGEDVEAEAAAMEGKVSGTGPEEGSPLKGEVKASDI